jgi:hypothetical protein
VTLDKMGLADGIPTYISTGPSSFRMDNARVIRSTNQVSFLGNGVQCA